MKVSPLYFALRNHFEGCKLAAYPDSNGIPTIGYGTTRYPDGRAVELGDTCTQEQAAEWATQDTLTAQTAVNLHFPGALQHQFDAMTDMAYNVGPHAWETSTVLKDAISKTGDIAAAFEMWDKTGHIDNDGLMRRCMARAYLYLNGTNSSDFCWQELQQWKAKA